MIPDPLSGRGYMPLDPAPPNGAKLGHFTLKADRLPPRPLRTELLTREEFSLRHVVSCVPLEDSRAFVARLDCDSGQGVKAF